jgi:hypothetical protein
MTRTLLALLLLLALPASAQFKGVIGSGVDPVLGTVALDNITMQFAEGSGPYNINFTVGSGSNRMLVVSVIRGNDCGANSMTTTSASWNGTAMTETIDDAAYTTAAGCANVTRHSVFTLAAPEVGSYTLSVQGTQSNGNTCAADCAFGVMIASLNGVNQTTPIRDYAIPTPVDGNTLFSSTVSSSTSDVVLEHACDGTSLAAGVTWGAGQTLVTTPAGTPNENASTTCNSNGATYKVGPGATATMEFTPPGDWHNHTVLSIRP